jgi:DNA-binding NarL/FixJ family response regulator
VLIIDDHDGFRRSAAALLEADGFVVVGDAGSGPRGIQLAAELRPDVVLVDVGLPDVDGFDVARELAALDGGSLVVLTSSRDAESYGPRLAAAEAAGFVPKDELSGEAIRSLAATGR